MLRRFQRVDYLTTMYFAEQSAGMQYCKKCFWLFWKIWNFVYFGYNDAIIQNYIVTNEFFIIIFVFEFQNKFFNLIKVVLQTYNLLRIYNSIYCVVCDSTHFLLNDLKKSTRISRALLKTIFCLTILFRVITTQPWLRLYIRNGLIRIIRFNVWSPRTSFS